MSPTQWKMFRDIALFVFGLLIISVNLVLWAVADRTPEPTLIGVGMAFAGLPFAIRSDERRRNGNGQ